MLRDDVQAIFRDVFEDDGMVIADQMTADDVERWDSLEHINLIVAVEKQFGIRFTTAEMANLKSPDQNVGTFIDLIDSKIETGN